MVHHHVLAYHLVRLRDSAIVGEFERAETALEQIKNLNSTIAIVDYSLPGMSGLEFAERMLDYPCVKVIIVSGHHSEYLSGNNPHGVTIIDKGNSGEILRCIIASASAHDPVPGIL